MSLTIGSQALPSLLIRAVEIKLKEQKYNGKLDFSSFNIINIENISAKLKQMISLIDFVTANASVNINETIKAIPYNKPFFFVKR